MKDAERQQQIVELKDRALKARKLLLVLRELRAKEEAILAELDTLWGGGVTLGAQMKQSYENFDRVWGAHYHDVKYVWQGVRDAPQMKRLVQSLGVEELEARFGRYLQNQDPFFVKSRHSFPIFVASVNQHTAPAALPDFELDPPADCKHIPPCRDDSEHTRRRMSDMRA